MAERDVQRAIIEYLRGRGAYVLNVGGSASTPKGTADLIVCYRGQFLALEVKKPKDSYGETKTQEIRRKQIRDAGGIAKVVTSYEDVLDLICAVDDWSARMGI